MTRTGTYTSGIGTARPAPEPENGFFYFLLAVPSDMSGNLVEYLLLRSLTEGRFTKPEFPEEHCAR